MTSFHPTVAVPRRTIQLRYQRLIAFIIAALVPVSLFFGPNIPAHAAATFVVAPITWNVVGLDSNNVNVGPNQSPVGAHVCNTGTATTGVTATLNLTGTPNPFVSI